MGFASYHPAINLLFFAAVACCTLWFTHPVFLFISYAAAFAYSVKLNRFGALVFNGLLALVAIAYGLWFAMTEHFGATVLFLNFIGNRMTLEAFVWGLVRGFSLAALLMWGSCLCAVFTADKVTYLLGRISPRLSLAFSVVLRAVPVVKDRARRIGLAQRCVGRGVGQGGVLMRLRNGVRQVSILVLWSIERFIEMSESMRSRGSLLRGRTAFSIYRFDNRDRLLFVSMVSLLTVVAAAAVLDQCRILYDPVIIANRVTFASYVFYGAYAAFCLLPLILQLTGEWRFSRQIKRIGESCAHGFSDVSRKDRGGCDELRFVE